MKSSERSGLGLKFRKSTEDSKSSMQNLK